MTRFLAWVSVIIAGAFIGILAATIIINSITSRPEAVPFTTTTSLLTPTSIDAEISTPLVVPPPVIPPLVTIPKVIIMSTVCEDFDNELWFWDMYAERSDGLDEDESYALLLAMSNEVHNDCPHHLDRLPSELLGD